ncbi:MAG TPA: hypothetical protein VND93_17930 [Myxococcales bacterium]|nr:hypothetical protein [Myxococcales bacterium]
MSEPQQPPPAAPAAGGDMGTGCPITADFLPPNMRKHVDPKAPVPLRMMAAKSLVPLAPADMCGALFMLTFDPDQGVRDTAAKTAASLPDRILSTALRDEGVKPPVLGYLLKALAGKEQYEELLILNASTPDEAVAACAVGCSAKVAEIVGQNQLRLLRHEDIIRQLCLNPNASPALLDGVCDFAVRSGLVLKDVPQMTAARVRLFGPEAAETLPDPGPTADEVLDEYAGLTDEGAPPMEEGKRLTLTQKIMKMNVAEKIKLATIGNKEARMLLVRDSNRLVSVAVVRSPRITDGEVLMLANNRAVPDDVLRVIYNNRDWTKMYPLKVALVKNPKTPSGIAMRFLGTLRESEVKEIARNKNVPSGIQMHAKKTMEKKNAPKKDDR